MSGYRYNSRDRQVRDPDGRWRRATARSRPRRSGSGCSGRGEEAALPKEQLAERLVDLEDENDLLRVRLRMATELTPLSTRSDKEREKVLDELCERLGAIVRDLVQNAPLVKEREPACLAVLLHMWTGERRSARTLGRSPYAEMISSGLRADKIEAGSRKHRISRKCRDQRVRMIHLELKQQREVRAQLLEELSGSAIAFASCLKPLE